MTRDNPRILTNIIEHIHVDIERLGKKFTVTVISCGGLDKDRRDERLKTLPTEIRRSGEIMALVLSGHTYYVLLKKGQSLDLSDDELAIKPIQFKDARYYIRDRLLLGALPKQILYPEGTKEQLFDAGDIYGVVYYPVEIRTIRGQPPKYMLIAVKVDIAKDSNFRDDKGEPLRYLISGVQTFVPEEALKKGAGKNKNFPRYRLDPEHYLVIQDNKGDYVKGSLGTRNRIDAINIKGESIDTYRKSRSGVLGLCLEHIREVYGDSMKIDLKRIPAEKHIFYKQEEIERSYKKIWDIMRRYDLKIINTTEHKDIVKLLEKKLDEDQFNWAKSDNPVDGCSNILIVDSKEEYEKNKEADPYQVIKKRYPDTVIQAFIYDNLLKGNIIQNFPYQAIIKELLLKHEINQKQFLLTEPPVPENVHFIYPHLVPSGNDDRKKICHFYSLVMDKEKMCFHKCDTKEIEDIVLDIEKDHLVFIQGDRDKDRRPFIYWPRNRNRDYIFFVATDAVALPEITEMMEDMKSLEVDREQSAGRSVLVDFIKEHPKTEVSKTIRSVLKAQPDADEFEYSCMEKTLRKNKTDRKDKRIFMDYVEQETGVKWTGSLRKKEDGYLDSNLGIFENLSEGVYYVGAVGPAKQSFPTFCHIYRLVTNMESIPDEIMSLIEGVFHIRHKQTTALPFPFKHLREYAKKDQLLSGT